MILDFLVEGAFEFLCELFGFLVVEFFAQLANIFPKSRMKKTAV